MEGVLRSFDTRYKQLGKHRKKCRACGKLISDGDSVHVEQHRQEKYYPVKGEMVFVKWLFWHLDCFGGVK